jgi:hypothetical protein
LGNDLFGNETIPIGLKLVDWKVSTTGVSIATYASSGKVKTGSVALEYQTEAGLVRRKLIE